MEVVAFIFARGGSKGLPGKNIKHLGNIPLIGHSILLAKEIKGISKIFVSSESAEIKSIAKEFGAHTIDRPKELASDNSSEWLSWQHAIKWLARRKEYFDVFVCLPATSPLRSKKDIYKCIKLLDKKTDIVITISKTTRSPHFNMLKKRNDGFFETYINDEKKYTRRQDVPKIYDMTTVAYVAWRNFILNANYIFYSYEYIDKVKYPSLLL